MIFEQMSIGGVFVYDAWVVGGCVRYGDRLLMTRKERSHNSNPIVRWCALTIFLLMAANAAGVLWTDATNDAAMF